MAEAAQKIPAPTRARAGSTIGRVTRLQTTAVRAVGERERVVRRRVMKQVVGVLILTMFFGIVHVWSRITVLNLRYSLTKVEQRVANLRGRIEHVEGEVAARKSIERLMRVAAEQLGLQPPASGQVIMVRSTNAGATP